MRKIQCLVALVALAGSFSAWGQALPKPAEFYFDEDRAPMVAVKGDDDATVKRLMQMAERDGRNSDTAHAQLAGLLMAQGRAENGRLLYQQLLNRLDTTNALRRPVLWHYGWDLYRAGDPAAALQQWQELLEGRGIEPSWAPPTLALVLWKLERKDEAIGWYAAAVRTEPRQWSTTALYPQLLPDWQEAERKDLADVQAAWAAKRPAWP